MHAPSTRQLLSVVVAAATVGAAALATATPALAAANDYVVTAVVSTGAPGSNPTAVAVDPTNHRIYAANSGRGTVVVINGTSNSLIATFNVGGSPVALALDPATHYLYVALQSTQTVLVLNTNTTQIIGSISVGSGPSALALDGTTLYVANKGSSSVSVINTSTFTVRATVGVARAPQTIVVDAAAGMVLVPSSLDPEMDVIDTSTYTNDYQDPIGQPVAGEALDPNSGNVYLANAAAGTVSVYNPLNGTITRTINVQAGPRAVAVDPSLNTVLVANAGSASVSVIDAGTQAVRQVLGVGSGPGAVALDSSSHTAYVANASDSTVSVLAAGASLTVSSVSPTTSSTVGGYAVTISGTGFTGVTAVRFGTTAATSFVVNSSTQITATAPAHASGIVDVTVTTSAGTSATSNADHFQYYPTTPTLTTTPSSGTAPSQSISESASLTGGYAPSGSIVFSLFGPADASCGGTPLAQRTATVGTGSVSSGAIAVSTVGTYHWSVAYSGDGNNSYVAKTCVDPTAVANGPLSRMVVSPADGVIGAGDSQGYAVKGYDAYGNDLGDVTSGSTFAISPDGSCTGATCTATVAGAHTVTATNGSVTASTGLSVNPGIADHLVLSPSSSSMAAGDSTTYAAVAMDAYGNQIGDVTPTTTFSITDGSCTGSVCTSTVAETHTVTASYHRATGTSTLTVTPAALAQLDVSPVAGPVQVGTPVQFVAHGSDQYGNAIGDRTGQTTFSIDAAGSCAGASCTATSAGPHTITGVSGGVSGSTQLSFAPAALDHIVLTPSATAITAGDSATYTVRGYDRYGNDLGDYTGSASIGIGPDGYCSGNVCTATAAGGHSVTASVASSVLTNTVLTVVPADLDHLTVVASAPSTVAGSPLTFTAEGYDVYDNDIGDVTDATTFVIGPNGTCNGAACSATKTGTHTVTAGDGTAGGSTTISVKPAAVDHVTVSPANRSIVAGSSATFRVVAFDVYGNSRGDVTPASGVNIGPDGSCSGSTCTATAAGVHTVVANYRNKVAFARLTVRPATAVRLAISPASSKIGLGTAQRYTVTAYDPYGNRSDVTKATTFSIGPDGSCSAARCTPAATGTHTVTASYGGLSVTAVLRVI